MDDDAREGVKGRNAPPDLVASSLLAMRSWHVGAAVWYPNEVVPKTRGA